MYVTKFSMLADFFSGQVGPVLSLCREYRFAGCVFRVWRPFWHVQSGVLIAFFCVDCSRFRAWQCFVFFVFIIKIKYQAATMVSLTDQRSHCRSTVKTPHPVVVATTV